MSHRIASLAMVLGLALTVSACNTMGLSPAGTTAAENSLYDRLGGKTAITAVVDDFVGRVAGDTRINGKFANANIPRLKSMLVSQICHSGGPCTHRPRHEEHPCGHGRQQQRLRCAGRRPGRHTEQVQGAGEGENELLGALGPMKGDIVEKPMASMQ